MLKTMQDLLAEVRAVVECVAIGDALEADGALLIDVREPAEAEARPVARSTNVPRGLVEIQLPQMAADPATPVFVHCASGARALLAAEQLVRLGYTNVKSVTCSIDDICAAIGDS